MIVPLSINFHLQRVRMKGPGSQLTKPFIAPFGRLYGSPMPFAWRISKLCWGDLNICPCLKIATHLTQKRFSSCSHS